MKAILAGQQEQLLPGLSYSLPGNVVSCHIKERSSNTWFPSGSAQYARANGLAEVTVHEVKAQSRVLQLQLEEHLGRQLACTEPIMGWLVRHAANCLSRYRMHADGRTPDQRRTGRRWRRPACEFGERVNFFPVSARREEEQKTDAERMSSGIFVGHRKRTGARFVSTAKGVMRGTRTQRRPAGEQFHNDYLKDVRGAPWQLKGEDPKPPERMAEPSVFTGARPAVVEPQRRRRYILKEDVRKYGGTGCVACRDVVAGRTTVSRPHTDDC